MSETSTTFLTLTPAMHQMDSPKREPGPIDHVTLNLAVESLSYHFVSGDKLGPLADSLKSATVEERPIDSESDSTPTEESKVEPPHSDDKPTDKGTTSETYIDEPVLPPTQNDKQDTAADHQDTVVATPNIVTTALPTQFLSPATVLKHRLINTKDLIVCPGVYDGFSARIALSVGFDAMYMVSNTLLRYLTTQACSCRPDRCRYYSLAARST